MEISPTGLGFDFWHIWNFGRAALGGLNPWSLSIGQSSFYPPATTYFLFGFFALFPITIGYISLIVLSVASLVAVSKRKALLLIFLLPIAHNLGAGNIDLLFLPLIPMLSKGRWKPIIAAALITLKPQIALVVLPWYCIRWLIRDREKLAVFVMASMILHLSPLLIRPTAFADWMGMLQAASQNKMIMAAGVWALGLPVIPIAILSIIAAVIALWLEDEKTSRAIMAIFSPIFSFYDAAILWDCAPLWLLMTSGAVSLAAAHFFDSYVPLSLVTWAVLIYRFWEALNESNLRHRTLQSSTGMVGL